MGLKSLNAVRLSTETQAVQAAQTALASAEGEASRTSADVRRIEPLIKKGLASQAKLDKARALSQDAQDRLLRARGKAKDAEAKLNQPAATVTTEEIVAVRAPAAGVVQTLSVHAGQRVAMGQPVATVISSS
jgi:multidrug resistance efflux pump